MNRDYEDKFAQMDKDFEDDITQMNRSYEDRVAQMRRDYENDVAQMNSEYEDKVRDVYLMLNNSSIDEELDREFFNESAESVILNKFQKIVAKHGCKIFDDFEYSLNFEALDKFVSQTPYCFDEILNNSKNNTYSSFNDYYDDILNNMYGKDNTTVYNHICNKFIKDNSKIKRQIAKNFKNKNASQNNTIILTSETDMARKSLEAYSKFLHYKGSDLKDITIEKLIGEIEEIYNKQNKDIETIQKQSNKINKLSDYESKIMKNDARFTALSNQEQSYFKFMIDYQRTLVEFLAQYLKEAAISSSACSAAYLEMKQIIGL